MWFLGFMVLILPRLVWSLPRLVFAFSSLAPHMALIPWLVTSLGDLSLVEQPKVAILLRINKQRLELALQVGILHKLYRLADTYMCITDRLLCHGVRHHNQSPDSVIQKWL